MRPHFLGKTQFRRAWTQNIGPDKFCTAAAANAAGGPDSEDGDNDDASFSGWSALSALIIGLACQAGSVDEIDLSRYSFRRKLS